MNPIQVASRKAVSRYTLMKSVPRIQPLVGLAILLLMTQCQNVTTQPPKAEGFDLPIPATISYLAGPVTFQLRELEDKINRELDPVLIGKEAKGGKKGGIFSFRVERSGPVRIQYVDQQIKFSAPLQLWLAKPFSSDDRPPKKPFCSLHVNFKSPLSVTPNWRLSSQVKFLDYQWVIQPEIKVLGKEISLTKFARNILDNHQESIEKAIDAAVYKDLRLDQTVNPIWQDIQKPLLVNKEYGLWLLAKPIGVEASPITGNNKEITTHLRIAFETQTGLKPTLPERPSVPLPHLQKRDTVSQTSVLRVMSFIPYADINRMLAQTVSREPKKLALGTLTIKKVSVYGGQRSVIVKAETDGLIDGMLYLRGRPTFDTLTNTLTVKNLQIDTATDNKLSSITGSVVRNGLSKLMEGLLTIPLGSEIAQLPQKINEAFRKGGASKKTDLGIKSFRFTPQQIAVRPDGIQVLIRVESNVAVQVKKL